MMTVAKQFVGVDGCKGGWFAFIKQAGVISYQCFTQLSDLNAYLASAACIFIDMPIGFPERGQPFRLCDKLARQLLPKRAASIFPVPCKAAVYAPDYAAACLINEHLIGKRFPIQTWNITPKIRELDKLVSNNIQKNSRGHTYYESHPEVVFAGLAGKPMLNSKSTLQGQVERLALLCELVALDMPVLKQALSQTPKKLAKADDIIDAFVLMYAAMQQQYWQFLPATADSDSDGNRRQIAYVVK